jgi:AhpD family alkylhydroperoxidase
VIAFEEPRLAMAKAAPAVYRAMVALGNAVELDATLRELVNLRASILNGCAYCIDMHWKDAQAAGESEERLYSVAAWHEAPFFTERERAALALTDAVTLVSETRVPRDVWDAAAAQFEPEELAHLVWAIAVINTWNRVSIAARTRPGEYEPRVNRQEHRNGVRGTHHARREE